MSISKLKIRRPIKCIDSSGRAHELLTRAIVFGISVQSFLLWLPSRTDQVPPTTTVNIFFVCFVDGYVTTSLYSFLLEVPVDDVFSYVYNNAQIYRHIITHIPTNTNPQYLHKVLPTVYYSYHLLISSRKSYQQYFDILLNYEQLEIYWHKQKK